MNSVLGSRKVVYRLYPSRLQEAALMDMLDAHRRLCNAAWEQRIAAWRMRDHGVTYLSQCRDLTILRAYDEQYNRINAQSAQVTLKRLDLRVLPALQAW